MSKSVFSEPYELLLEALIEGRQASGLRQTDLAERLGKPQSFVSKYENGERRLDVVEFLVITKTLDVDHHGLIDRIGGLLEPDTRI